MSDPLLPVFASGDNVFKFLVTFCIGLIAFNLLYPRDKSLEIKQLRSEFEYQCDLLEVKIEPIRVTYDELTTFRSKLDSINKITGNYPIVLKSEYDSLFTCFDDGLSELNILNADLEHKQRMISNLDIQLKYYERISFWTFWPAIILGFISLYFWILFSVKNSKKES